MFEKKAEKKQIFAAFWPYASPCGTWTPAQQQQLRWPVVQPEAGGRRQSHNSRSSSSRITILLASDELNLGDSSNSAKESNCSNERKPNFLPRESPFFWMKPLRSEEHFAKSWKTVGGGACTLLKNEFKMRKIWWLFLIGYSPKKVTFCTKNKKVVYIYLG